MEKILIISIFLSIHSLAGAKTDTIYRDGIKIKVTEQALGTVPKKLDYMEIKQWEEGDSIIKHTNKWLVSGLLPVMKKREPVVDLYHKSSGTTPTKVVVQQPQKPLWTGIIFFVMLFILAVLSPTYLRPDSKDIEESMNSEFFVISIIAIVNIISFILIYFIGRQLNVLLSIMILGSLGGMITDFLTRNHLRRHLMLYILFFVSVLLGVVASLLAALIHTPSHIFCFGHLLTIIGYILLCTALAMWLVKRTHINELKK